VTTNEIKYMRPYAQWQAALSSRAQAIEPLICIPEASSSILGKDAKCVEVLYYVVFLSPIENISPALQL
jgi:hypothetical protein